MTRLEQASSLDPASERLRRAVVAVIRPRRLRDLLHGVWLGHPLHPAMVQAPIGAWMAASVLDLLPGAKGASTAMVGLGTATALPSAVAGLTDWSELAPEQRRVGLVHAMSNVIATSLYAGSFLARLSGRHRTGKMLALAGLSAAGTGAFLGGHMSYRQGAGVNHAIADLRQLPSGWHRLGRLNEIPDDQTATARMGEVPVLMYRRGDQVTVLLERCAHQSGPLGEGTLSHEHGETCVTCPWHGTTFRLSDGAVLHGPGATDQPVLESRIGADGVIEARMP